MCLLGSKVGIEIRAAKPGNESSAWRTGRCESNESKDNQWRRFVTFRVMSGRRYTSRLEHFNYEVICVSFEFASHYKF